MTKLMIKALSVNQAYQGRRFATPELKAYKEALTYILPKTKIPKGKLFAQYEFGVSSKASDADNLVKATQDCLAKKYGFDDKNIYRLHVSKVDVKKGNEYVAFRIEPLL